MFSEHPGHHLRPGRQESVPVPGKSQYQYQILPVVTQYTEEIGNATGLHRVAKKLTPTISASSFVLMKEVVINRTWNIKDDLLQATGGAAQQREPAVLSYGTRP